MIKIVISGWHIRPQESSLEITPRILSGISPEILHVILLRISLRITLEISAGFFLGIHFRIPPEISQEIILGIHPEISSTVPLGTRIKNCHSLHGKYY